MFMFENDFEKEFRNATKSVRDLCNLFETLYDTVTTKDTKDTCKNCTKCTKKETHMEFNEEKFGEKLKAFITKELNPYYPGAEVSVEIDVKAADTDIDDDDTTKYHTFDLSNN